MQYLLEQGFSPDVSDAIGTSLVQLFPAWGNPVAMQVLQEYGVDYHEITQSPDTAHPAWQATHEFQIVSVERILNSGLSIDCKYQGMS